MPQAPPDRVKLTVEIRADQQRALQNYIPWGAQRAFFEALIDDIIIVLNEFGPVAVFAVLDNQVRPGSCNAVIRALLEGKQGGEKGEPNAPS